MEIEFLGANCFKILHQKAAVIIDDNLAELGAKTVTKDGDIAIFTTNHKEPSAKTKLVIDQPGEYEVSNISIVGVSARSHMGEPDKQDSVMYKLVAGEIKLAVVGHIYPELSDEQLEKLGMVDILIIPVGNSGYTLDAVGALKVIKKIEPKMVIPSHYDLQGIKYPVPQHKLEDAIKELSMEPKEQVDKLKIKLSDLASEGTELVVIKK